MTKTDWKLLRGIVEAIAAELQDGAAHGTADDWTSIANELARASALAESEASRLFDVEAS